FKYGNFFLRLGRNIKNLVRCLCIKNTAAQAVYSIFNKSERTGLLPIAMNFYGLVFQCLIYENRLRPAPPGKILIVTIRAKKSCNRVIQSMLIVVGNKIMLAVNF